MADHSQDDNHGSGSMDIREQERTYAAFIRWVGWGIAISVGTLIFLALVNS